MSHSPSRREPGTGVALAPAETFRAVAIGLGEVAAGEWLAGGGVFFGLVDEAELDGIDLHLFGEFVDGNFEGEGPDGFAGGAHEGIGDHVHVGDLLADQEGLSAVEVTRRKGELLGCVVVQSHGGDAGVDERGEVTVRGGADGYSLLGGGAAADGAVDAFAGEHEADRLPGHAGGCGGEDVVLPQGFAAEAAADVGRRDVDLAFLEVEDLFDRPCGLLDALRGVVNVEFVFFPEEGDGVQLDGVVIVARGAEL